MKLLDRPVRVLDNVHSGSIHTVKFNSSGTYILSGGQDRKVVLSNAETGAFVKSYALHAYEVLDIAIARDSSMFASCGGDKTVYLWDAASGHTIRRFSGHIARVNSVAFNNTETVLLSGSYDGTVRLWDLRNTGSTKPVQVLSDAKDSVSSVDVHGHRIATASVDGKLRVYDLRMGQLTTDSVTAMPSDITRGTSTATPLTSVMISQDGDTALVASLDSTVRLMDLESGLALQAYVGHQNSVFRMRAVLDDDRGTVLSASEDGCVFLWDLMAGEEPASRIVVEAPSASGRTPLAFDLDQGPEVAESGRRVAASTRAGQLKIYNVLT